MRHSAKCHRCVWPSDNGCIFGGAWNAQKSQLQLQLNFPLPDIKHVLLGKSQMVESSLHNHYITLANSYTLVPLILMAAIIFHEKILCILHLWMKRLLTKNPPKQRFTSPLIHHL